MICLAIFKKINQSNIMEKNKKYFEDGEVDEQFRRNQKGLE